MADMTQAEFNSMLQIALAQGFPGGIYMSKFGRGEDIDAALDGGAIFNEFFASPEFHRNVFRGRYLGTIVTPAQITAIRDGTFKDLFVGDYWIINGVTWRIVDIDYFYNTGNPALTDHHALIVPDRSLSYAKMNDTPVTIGGYVGSKIYTEVLATAKNTIKNAFGSLVLTHKDFFVNAVSDGHPSGASWYDSEVELMNEIMVYGSHIFAPMSPGTAVFSNQTIGKCQVALFTVAPKMINVRDSYWLRDVASGTSFCFVNNNGLANQIAATSELGVRPYFIIG